MTSKAVRFGSMASMVVDHIPHFARWLWAGMVKPVPVLGLIRRSLGRAPLRLALTVGAIAC